MSEDQNQPQPDESGDEVDERHEADVQLGHAFRRDIEDENNVTERPESDPEYENASGGEDSDSDEAVDNEGNPIHSDDDSSDEENN